MELGLASVITLGSLENLVDTDSLVTACVVILRAEWIGRHLDLGRLLVEATITHLSNWVKLHATVTFNQMEVGPDLPVNFLPRDTVSLSDKSYEFLKVPVLVNHMLGSHLAVRVDETGSFAAAQYLALLLCEQFVAVGALVQVILLFLKKKF